MTTAAPPAGSRLALLLWVMVPVFELPTVAVASSALPEVAAASPFGSPGTELVALAVLLSTLWGVVVAWRPHGTPVRVRLAVVLLLSVAVGITTVLAVRYITSGDWPAIGILLTHCAAAIGMVARTIYQSTRRSATEGRGR